MNKMVLDSIVIFIINIFNFNIKVRENNSFYQEIELTNSKQICQKRNLVSKKKNNHLLLIF